MSSVERYYTLLGIMAFILGALIWVVTRSYTIGRTYQQGLDKMNEAASDIVELGSDIKELVRQKERDHDELRNDTNKIETRLERHLEWHDNQKRRRFL